MTLMLVRTVLRLVDACLLYGTPSATDLHVYFAVDDLLCWCVELARSSMFSLRSMILSPSDDFNLKRGREGGPPHFQTYQAFDDFSFLFFYPPTEQGLLNGTTPP